MGPVSVFAFSVMSDNDLWLKAAELFNNKLQAFFFIEQTFGFLQRLTVFIYKRTKDRIMVNAQYP